MTEPASIRYRNPGAMWGGAHARRWGAVDDVVLKDGQSNHIAVFPSNVKGAAAQFDLWRRVYVGMTLAAAIDKWSGHNSPKGYVAALQAATGIGPNESVTPAILAGPKGLALMKAQAKWEAGKPYPMTDAEWLKAQDMVFGKPKSSTAATTVGAAAGTAAATAEAGWPVWAVFAAMAGAAVIAIFAVRYLNNRK